MIMPREVEVRGQEDACEGVQFRVGRVKFYSLGADIRESRNQEELA